ncbi:hypothetical protein MFIFM68171_02407 [Madurella fahalii]|uniref:FHA domain-containing protein n=1 Tax=Madurella fahalii TaxID=1157608 RepID=A0ABQ0G384_9PEZI
MADPDLIARLYPYDDRRGWATTVVKGTKPFAICWADTLAISRGILQSSRSATNGAARNTSDIVLVNQNGISEHHCAIAFENNFNDTSDYRVVVRDLKSSYRTSVEYDHEAGRHHDGVRCDFRWIVSGHPTPEGKGTIVIELYRFLKFQIVVSDYDTTSPHYIDNVNWFRQGVMSMDDLFCHLGLPSRLPTEPPSGVHTPGTGAIYLKKKLGEGAFGVVTHYWDVSDGDEYAIKQPSTKAIR